MTSDHKQSDIPTHFNGKEALEHVIEAHAEGLMAAAEMHGAEPSGSFSAAEDAARETAVVLPIFWILITHLTDSRVDILYLISLFTCGWILWKMGRGAWLGWFRLERLHRILEQEKWEIEHHRQQERDELRVLYAAKGFEGKLLEDVLDVLMADNDRLLKVMIEEELGLSLGKTEHPLKQGLGAAVGVAASAFICLLFLIVWPTFGIFIGTALTLSFSAALSAYMARNQIIPAIVWNLGLATLALGIVHFLLQWHLHN
ncbi:MAG: VIT1/CCC1 transporter family protein [Parachlamydiaceae bacterium]